MREVMKMLVAAIGLTGWLTTAAVAAPLVSGAVTARNGAPLPDVKVQAEIRTVRTATPTDAGGQFRFDAGTVFPASEVRDATRLMVMFSKPGYRPLNRMLTLTPGQSPPPVTVQLDPESGGAALAPAEEQVLKQYAAAPGSAPLFLVPYALEGVDPSKVNDVLRANLERVIVTHLQAAAVTGTGTVGLKLLPVTAPANDIDRLRTYGTYLNALAMITGYGKVEGGGGTQTLGVSSVFLVIPQSDPVTAPVLYVDDDVPADRVTSPRLYQHLSKVWGRSTVLAIGVSEFGKAKASRDKEALRRIRKYLQAERASAGPGDEALVSQIAALIDAVDKELAR
jgi:hypothetical protein